MQDVRRSIAIGIAIGIAVGLAIVLAVPAMAQSTYWWVTTIHSKLVDTYNTLVSWFGADAGRYRYTVQAYNDTGKVAAGSSVKYKFGGPVEVILTAVPSTTATGTVGTIKYYVGTTPVEVAEDIVAPGGTWHIVCNGTLIITATTTSVDYSLVAKYPAPARSVSKTT